jgi:hypothetical protein
VLTVCVAQADLSAQSSEFSRGLQRVARILQHKQLPPALRHRLLAFYAFRESGHSPRSVLSPVAPPTQCWLRSWCGHCVQAARAASFMPSSAPKCALAKPPMQVTPTLSHPSRAHHIRFAARTEHESAQLDESDLLDNLPRSLRLQIDVAVHRPLFLHLPLFRMCSDVRECAAQTQCSPFPCCIQCAAHADGGALYVCCRLRS